jgi:membrane-bound metal-dependent hydrolase YbcI (DUF457 family)
MPTPAGHAIAGLAAAFLTNATARRPRLTKPILVSAAVLAVLPDLDIIAGLHRTHSHSVAAIAVVGLVAWIVLGRRVPDALPLALALAAAFGSHAVLDLLGKDTRDPRGLMVLWPFSSTYYITGWDVFGEVSRRYWLPSEFVFGNLRALAWEMVVLLPVLILAWAFWSKRTLGS